jgi:uncharacterized protein (TIGR00255 family)
MIRSMTAFVAETIDIDQGSVGVELRSINHRYLDLHVRLPDMLRASEMPLRELLKSKLKRGRIDLFVRFQPAEADSGSLSVNETVLQQLSHQHVAIKDYFPEVNTSLFDVLRWPGVVEKRSIDVDALPPAVLGIVETAVAELVVQREREGASVGQFILDCLSQALGYHKKIQQSWPRIQSELRSKLEDRVAQVKADVDPDRFEQELLFLVQKQDIAEEIQRLETHIEETTRVVEAGGVVGRRLDFLMQELNREANTIASKSQDSELTKLALEIKVLIEQIREQVQNIE